MRHHDVSEPLGGPGSLAPQQKKGKGLRGQYSPCILQHDVQHRDYDSPKNPGCFVFLKSPKWLDNEIHSSSWTFKLALLKHSTQKGDFKLKEAKIRNLN